MKFINPEKIFCPVAIARGVTIDDIAEGMRATFYSTMQLSELQVGWYKGEAQRPATVVGLGRGRRGAIGAVQVRLEDEPNRVVWFTARRDGGLRLHGDLSRRNYLLLGDWPPPSDATPNHDVKTQRILARGAR